MSDSLRLVITNCPASDSPRIAETLVREKLAACVNVIPGVRSYYTWQGEFHADEEETLLIKTTSRALQELSTRLEALHPYSTPEIVVVQPSDVNAAYLRWAVAETGGGP